nr:putative ribonuclease H-like domain-containing protein [Tanacetum cinerariifolium]
MAITMFELPRPSDHILCIFYTMEPLLLGLIFQSVMVLVAMIRSFRQMKNQQIMPSWHSPPQVLPVLIMRKSQFDVLSYNTGLESVKASSKSDVSMPTSLVHDRYKLGEGYHVVPPPYTGTFMPLKPDLVFYDTPTTNETVPTVLTVKPSTSKPNKDLSQSNRPSAPIIKDWVSNSEDESEGEPMPPQIAPRKDIPNSRGHRHSWNRKACFVCKSLTHLIKDCDYYKKKIVQKPGNQHHALKDRGVIDSSCSRHMMGNISYLSDFEELNGGYVAFDGNPKGGKITGKGKIRTRKLDFNDVYFVKELQFNLFSVSQMYNKKNIVLFTYTECIVLSFDFKLPDEHHMLLRVPKENKMYNVDLKNIVKGNLVRGLPSKVFENNHTCVACKKGKQHRAFYPLGKFNRKVDEGFLVRYSVSSKALRVFNSITRIVQETLHINFMKNQTNVARSGPTWLFDIDTLTQSMNYQPVVTGNQLNSSACIQENFTTCTGGKEALSVQQYVLLPLWSSGFKDPLNTNVVSFDVKEPESAVHVSLSSCDKTKKHDDKTKRAAKGKSSVEFSTGVRDLSDDFEEFYDKSLTGLTFKLGGKSSFVDPSQYLGDSDMPALEYITHLNDKEDVGVEADFSNLETIITVLVDLIKGKRAKGSKWVFINKKDERGIVVRNKARLVAHGHTREEGIDYEKVFAPVARIEAIRLFLAYASFIGFMVYQMDVKSAFIYGTIKEEVYVCQPLGFEDPIYPDKVYKVVKALYGLHQVPRAWYKTLASDLLENSFQRGKIDQTLFIKKQKGDILLVQIYVDNIILDLPIKTLKQKQDGIFISQDKYLAEILRKFGLTNGKSASTPIDTEKPLLKDPDVRRIFRYLKGKPHLGLWYPKDSPFNLVAYSDSDYARASLDRKSTTGGCQFLGCRLISWQCKKHTVVATSSTKAEYVAAASCCAQVLWIQNQLLDYGNKALAIPGQTETAILDPVSIKKSNDVVRLQALINRKKVIITEDSIRQDFCLDDADSVDCLPNEEIFAELARMGYENPSIKLTFYKAFFSAQWKVRKGFSGVDTPLFVGILVPQQVHDVEDAAEDENDANEEDASKQGEIAELDADEDVTLEEVDAEVIKDADVQGRLKESQAKVYHLNLEHADKVLKQVKRKERQDNIVMKYQALKRKPAIEAHARKNLMVYLKNMVGFKMDFFKGMTYIKIRPIFEKHFNSIWAFLEKGENEIEVEESKESKRKNDVYTEATHLALKVPVVDCQIHTKHNKPYYKIIRADGTHQLFLSFITLLRNFDKEDLEMLWKIVQERFKSSEPENFSDDFLLNAFKLCLKSLMLKLTYGEIKKEMILLVERKYPLTRFTLEQMLNNVRLEVKEESEMSLKMLSFGVDVVEDFEENMLRDYCCWFWLKLLVNVAGIDMHYHLMRIDAHTNSTNLLNTISTLISVVGPSRAFNDGELSYPDDPLMPHLKDIYDIPSKRIFTNSSYNDEGVTRSKVNKNSKAHALISQALEDESWVDAMKEELLQFQIQKVWILVDLPFGKKSSGTKWVYRNKKDERGVVVRNKERLVSQGHRQEEGIDYDEVFAPVARIEAIQIFLDFASYMGFIVYQVNVKSAFLYGIIDEEVYVTQPPSFVDPKFPNKVYKFVKALYGLHQAPRACVKTASTLIETQKPLVKDEEAADVDVYLYRSMIGSLMYLTASRPYIMYAVCACSRFQFWALANIKKVNDVVKLRALIDRKQVVVTEDVIRQALYLDDADRVECLPNEEIFTELAHMVYEKPPPNAKRTVWNEFSCSMESVVICLATGRNFNFFKYIFDSMVRKVDSPTKFLIYPRFLQVIINAQVDDLSSHNNQYTSPTLTQKVFANMRRVGKGFSGIETPLFATMLVQPQPPAAEEEDEVEVPNAPTPPSLTTAPSPPPKDPIPIPLQAQPAIPPVSSPQEQPIDTSESSMTLLNTLMETCTTLSQKGRIDNVSAAATNDVSVAEPTVFNDEEVTMTMAQTLINMKAKKARLLDEQMAKGFHDKEVEQATAREKQEKDDLEKAKGLQQQGMTYDKVIPIFEKEYNKVQTLFKPDKDVEEPQKKRVAEETLLQERFKKLKAVKVSGSESIQETLTNDPKEMSKEDVQNMLEIVPVSEFKVEALQLQVEEDSEMARDLMMKIFMEANKPKSKVWIHPPSDQDEET